MRTVWTWLAIGGAILALNIAPPLFGITQAQLTNVLLGVCLMVLYWQGTMDSTAKSVSGTKQTSSSTLNMSAFGGKADISDRLADVQ